MNAQAPAGTFVSHSTNLSAGFAFEAAQIPLHDATALTQGGTQARILLNGQVYDLRITRAGKLILTK